ncbi:hypothetical protein HOY80DRAFT_1053874 [Tuber brumale]|nr:hypothetical protein HOY80DRAFT_1053874 [Tuber brumale]
MKLAKGNENGKGTDKEEWKKVEGQKCQNIANVAKRKFFTMRVTSKPLANATADKAKISVSLSKTLMGSVWKALTVLQVSSNRLNSTVMVTIPQGSDSRQYSRYFDKLMDTLNQFVTKGEPAFLPSRRVPTDVNVLIHGIPLEAIPTDHAELDAEVKQQLKELHKIDLTSAKFFRVDPKSQEGK